jgi:hypothetical protein
MLVAFADQLGTTFDTEIKGQIGPLNAESGPL